jgi:hypothetical protein
MRCCSRIQHLPCHPCSKSSCVVLDVIKIATGCRRSGHTRQARSQAVSGADAPSDLHEDRQLRQQRRRRRHSLPNIGDRCVSARCGRSPSAPTAVDRHVSRRAIRAGTRPSGRAPSRSRPSLRILLRGGGRLYRPTRQQPDHQTRKIVVSNGRIGTNPRGGTRGRNLDQVKNG